MTTLKPCHCGKSEIPVLIEGTPHCRYVCDKCDAATPVCKTPEAAARCWNAAMVALEEVKKISWVVGWEYSKLSVEGREVGTCYLYKSISGARWGIPGVPNWFSTREQAEAALLAHVMEGK